MTAPSKRTKAELQNRLAETEYALAELQKRFDRREHGIKRGLEKEKRLQEEVDGERKLLNRRRNQVVAFEKRYGKFRDRQNFIQIRAQTHYPASREKAREIVKALFDAGIWYFEVGECK